MQRKPLGSVLFTSAMLCLAGLAACSTPTPSPDAGGRQVSSVTPSGGPEVDLNDAQYSVLHDYFMSSDERTKFLMEPRFSSNADNAALAARGRKALQEAFSRSFFDLSQVPEGQDTASSMGALVGKFKTALPVSLVDNFVKTIFIYKIFGLRVRYDIAFVPEQVDAASFRAEMASNDLTTLESKGRLSTRLRRALGDRELAQVVEHMKTLGPQRSGRPTFVGGSISVAADILNLNPAKALGPQDQLFTGELRFRRYLRHTPPVLARVNDSGEWDVRAAGFVDGGMSAIVSTVDLVYTFDRKEKTPKFARVDIYPGRIVASPRAPGKEESEHVVSEFQIRAVDRSERGTTGAGRDPAGFAAALARVSFDAQTREPLADTTMVVARGRDVLGARTGGLKKSLLQDQVVLLKSLTVGLVEDGGPL